VCPQVPGTRLAPCAKPERSTHCAHKGDAGYATIFADGRRAGNAISHHETAFHAMAQIERYFAFYSDRAERL
jgi:uncharacterized protein (DUF427 family)